MTHREQLDQSVTDLATVLQSPLIPEQAKQVIFEEIYRDMIRSLPFVRFTHPGFIGELYRAFLHFRQSGGFYTREELEQSEVTLV